MREHLGLYDTPADRRQVRFSLVVFGVLLAAFLVVMPVRNIPLGPVAAFVPTIDGIELVDEVMISVLLYAQATVFRSRALTLLASGYLLSALLLVPHALTFPGAFSPAGLLGAKVNTTAWLATYRRLVFPGAVILYALFKRFDAAEPREAQRPQVRPLRWILAAIALAVLAALSATFGHDWLPPLFSDARTGILVNLLVLNFVTAALTGAAIVLLFRPDKTVLDLWLRVAMFGWLGQFIPLDARFTIGWYYLFGSLLASNLVVMVALIAETNRLYARLALSTAARDRERENRLLSMDAVAAALAHEVGQPLAAIRLNAVACLGFLGAERPNLEKAIQSTRDSLETADRAFAVIKSVRAMFTKGLSPRTQFSLNDLALETAALLDREMAAQRVSLDLDLDPNLPPIEGNRVQVQRILLNLITNAIESLGATRRQSRQIAIRTLLLDGDEVLLQVSDSGIGVPPEEMGRIFEPFYTTKPSGMGLGLSLCQSIVEDHGGRLWVSPSEQNGVTFHLQMPRNRESLH